MYQHDVDTDLLLERDGIAIQASADLRQLLAPTLLA